MLSNITGTVLSFGFGAQGNMVVNDPGFIVGPLAGFFGAVLNAIFEFVNGFATNNVLGISIILLTLFVRVIMIPLAIKTQKSMVAMQALAPEMNKIKKKYENNKSRENQQKMNAEVQALYAKNKVNPFGGCLPLLAQMPIFISLMFIMQQSYRYVSEIGAVFGQISAQIISLLDILGRDAYIELARTHFDPKIPNNITHLNAGIASDVESIVSRFSMEDWYAFIADIPVEMQVTMRELVAQKDALEMFFGVNLSQLSGIAFPGIIIPILAGITTFLSSYFMTKISASMTTDPMQKQMQKVMLYMMPLMLGFFTINFPAGVGVYWVASSIFQFVQQIVLNKLYFKQNAQAAS